MNFMDNNSFEEKKNENINNIEPAEEVAEAASEATESSEAAEVAEANAAEATEAAEAPATEEKSPETTYHMSGEEVPEASYTYIPRSAEAPSVAPEASISYKPEASAKPKNKKKRGGRVAGSVVLVICCIIFSFGFGLVGSYVGNEIFADTETPVTGQETEQTEQNQSDSADKGGSVIVVDRVIEHVTTSSDGSEMTYSDVEAAVGDAVVAISTEYKSVGMWQEYVTSGAGSGVIMSSEGHIITNYHVVAASDGKSYADVIKVRLKNGDEYEATVIGGDADADIAVIKIQTEKTLVSAAFADSDKLAVGEEVIAIGNPLGELSGTTTNGIISALARSVNIEGVDMNLLQTNAAVNPGNSGGGLFNMSGELIGIVNAKSSGTGIEGLGFAIPSNDAYAKAKEIIEAGGNVGSSRNVMIGVEFLDVLDAYTAYRYGVDSLGVYVYNPLEGYNDKVLRKGDRVIAVNGQEISESAEIASVVKAAEPGDLIEFTVFREGRVTTVDVKCYEGSVENGVHFNR